ncbi:hypothetical protein H0O00_02280, partial [Candidatus Micrarchaeota archaeon]|nr:hypothetical protein [Candidatus Micrarchaeota archaeon]
NERMGAEHPDFAWMREGGTSLYSRDREPRRGPPRRPYGEGRPRREGYPSYGTHPGAAHPHAERQTTHPTTAHPHGEGRTAHPHGEHVSHEEHRPYSGPPHRRRTPHR